MAENEPQPPATRGSSTIIDLRSDPPMRHRQMRGRPHEGDQSLRGYRNAPAMPAPSRPALHSVDLEIAPDRMLPPTGLVATAPRPTPALDADTDSAHTSDRRRRFLMGDLVVRRIRLRSIIRVSLAFYLCLLAVVLVAGAVLWNLANRAGWVTSWTGFLVDIGFTTANVEGPTIFRASATAGLVLVATATGLTLAAAIIYNQISGLVGGIEMSFRTPRRSRRARRRAEGLHAQRRGRRRRRHTSR